jgi:cell division protein FtsB
MIYLFALMLVVAFTSWIFYSLHAMERSFDVLVAKAQEQFLKIEDAFNALAREVRDLEERIDAIEPVEAVPTPEEPRP